jgi:hypothetical protein
MARFVAHKAMVFDASLESAAPGVASPGNWARSLLFLHGQFSFIRAHFVARRPETSRAAFPKPRGLCMDKRCVAQLSEAPQ